MTVEQIQAALEEAFNSLEEADSELLEKILEGDEFVDPLDVSDAKHIVEQTLYAVRRFNETQA